MSDLIKKIKIKKQDDTYTDYIPIGAEAKNVDCSDGESVEYKLNKKPYYYNNVADMKADTSLKVGDMAITLGYYEPNDGGASEYKIIKGTYIDDGGNYHKLENNLYAELIVKNAVDIRQFGVKGIESWDDAPAIQNAIDYCCSHSLKLLFSINTYVKNTFTINAPIVLDGCKSTITYTNNNNTLNSMFKINDYVEDVSIINFIIEANSKCFGGVYSKNNKNIVIRDCSILNSSNGVQGGFGIDLSWCSFVTVENCYIYNTISLDGGNMAGDAIAVNFCNDILINNNIMKKCGRHDMSVYGLGHHSFYSQYNIKVTNNRMEDSYFSGIDTETGQNILIDGNTFLENGKKNTSNMASAICLKGDINQGTAYYGSNLIVTNNNITGSEQGRYCISMDNYCGKSIISNNIIDANGITAFNTYAGDGALEMNIENNQIKNARAAFNIYISPSYQQYIQINNNLIKDCTEIIAGSSFRKSHFHNNICKNCSYLTASYTRWDWTSFQGNFIEVSDGLLISPGRIKFSKTTFNNNTILYLGETNIPLLFRSGFENDDKGTQMCNNMFIGNITNIIANYEKTIFDDDLNGNNYYKVCFANNQKLEN